MKIEIQTAKRKAPAILAGAVMVAIEKAQRFGTPLVIKANGHIEKISPKAMKRRLNRKL